MFIEEYLRDLRQARFTPRAIGTYARRVGARVRLDLLASPSAVRSIWTLALAYFALAFVAAAGISWAWDREMAVRFFVDSALWMLGAFGFVTLFIGLLRDPSGYRLSSLNVPLALTLLRVALLPGICVFLEEHHYTLALVAYVVAGLSDVFDGWLARRWRQITPMGTVLDPLVDIVFNLAVLFALTAAGLLPRWVFWIGFTRYATLVVGGAALYLFVGPVTIRPTVFGRFTGVVMTSLIALFTLFHALHAAALGGMTRLTEVALGLLLGATTAQIVLVGWYNLRLMTGGVREHGHVVGDVRWRSR